MQLWRLWEIWTARVESCIGRDAVCRLRPVRGWRLGRGREEQERGDASPLERTDSDPGKT
jgi:hypothetical protein